MRPQCDESCSGCPSPQRRGFLGAAIALGALVLLLPRRALARKLAIPLAKLPALQRVGASIVLQIHGRAVLLIRDSQTSVSAFSGSCTHKKTAVRYDPKSAKIVCPEHGSLFAMSGQVLKGPATVTLPRFWAKLDLERERILLKL